MTTRFSLAELADMLHVPVSTIRQAVDTLAAEDSLTAESFIYMEKNWRISPSDVKRVQMWIEQAVESGRIVSERPARRVKRKQVIVDVVDE